MRLSEDKSKEKFTEMPLCLIRQKYEGLPGGKKFVEDIIASIILSNWAHVDCYRLDSILLCFNGGLVRSERQETPTKQ